jgi:hypothetical protein
MENAKLDYKATIDRMAEACRWKVETTNGWINKGELACGNLMERAEAALKEAEEKEEAEAKIRIMESQCEVRGKQQRSGGKQQRSGGKLGCGVVDSPRHINNCV